MSTGQGQSDEKGGSGASDGRPEGDAPSASARAADGAAGWEEASADVCGVLDTLSELPAREALAALGPASEFAVRLESLADAVASLASRDPMIAMRRSLVLVGLADAAGSPAPQARSHRAAARAFANAGRLADSLDHCRKGIAIADGHAIDIESGRLRLASMHALAELGRLEEAAAAGELAIEVFRRCGENRLAARAAMNLGVVDVRRDRPEAALRRFDEAEAALRSDPLLAGQIDSNRGEAFVVLGRFDDARRAFESAWDRFRSVGAEWQAAIALGNLGDLAQRAGRLGEALERFEEARVAFERTGSIAHLARIVAEQAETKAMLGLLEESLRDSSEAVRWLDDQGQALEAARARQAQAAALLALGRIEEAEEALVAAASSFRSLGHGTAATRTNLARAEIRCRLGDLDEAGALAEEAAASLRGADRPIDAAVAARVLGAVALRRGDPKRAMECAEEGLATAEALRIAPLLVDLRRLRGLARRALGDIDGSIEDLRAAVEAIEATRALLQAERLRAGFAGQRLRVYEDLVAGLLDRGGESMPGEVFAIAEKSRSRVLLDLLRGQLQERIKSADPAEAALRSRCESLRADLNVLYDRLASEGGEGLRQHCLQVSHAIRRREAELTAIETRIEARSGGTAAAEDARTRQIEGTCDSGGTARTGGPDRACFGGIGPGVGPVDAEALMAALPRGTVTLDYYFAGDELVVLVGERGRLEIRRGLAQREQVEDLVSRLHFQMSRGLTGPRSGLDGRRRIDDARRVLGALHGLLLAPVACSIAKAESLAVVPHGALHLVPFGALWDGQRHLVERLPVWHSPSASALVHIARRRRTREVRGTARALVVAVADVKAPRIEQEASAVAALLGAHRTTMLCGTDATRSRVAALAAEADVVHFACHGRFSASAVLASGLRLADGWWTLRELGDLRLRADLVVLAGCETGRSLVRAGDELVGLAHSFLVGGAASLVVGGWRVDDAAALAFATTFHDHRRRAIDERVRLPTATSLQATQIALLRDRPHPAFWAPFILIGAP